MENLNILWIEDEGKYRLYEMIEPLQDDGHNVDIAEDAKEARDCFESKKYDFILLDLHLPKGVYGKEHESDMNGKTLMDELIDERGYNHTQMLIFSVIDVEQEEWVQKRNIKTMKKGKILPNELKEKIYEITGWKKE